MRDNKTFLNKQEVYWEHGFDLLMLDDTSNNLFTKKLGEKHPRGYSIKHLKIKKVYERNPALTLIHVKDLKDVTIGDTIKIIKYRKDQAKVLLKKEDKTLSLEQKEAIEKDFSVKIDMVP